MFGYQFNIYRIQATDGKPFFLQYQDEPSPREVKYHEIMALSGTYQNGETLHHIVICPLTMKKNDWGIPIERYLQNYVSSKEPGRKIECEQKIEACRPDYSPHEPPFMPLVLKLDPQPISPFKLELIDRQIPDASLFKPNEIVTMHNLTKADCNGCRARVIQFDAASQRYMVQGLGPTFTKSIKVKSSKLQRSV